jgi:hypothetical protein
MFTLIRREIEDAALYFFLAIIFAGIMVSVLLSAHAVRGGQAVGIPGVMHRNVFTFMFLPWLLGCLGATQMYLDRNRKISAFLATLGTTRGRIFAGRVITGVLLICVIMLPIVVTDVVLLKVFPRAAVPDAWFLRNVFIVTFLCSLASYGFGLQVGYSYGKVICGLGVFFVGAVLVSLIFIKGFGIESMVILSLFAVAALVRAGQKFMSASF